MLTLNYLFKNLYSGIGDYRLYLYCNADTNPVELQYDKNRQQYYTFDDDYYTVDDILNAEIVELQAENYYLRIVVQL